MKTITRLLILLASLCVPGAAIAAPVIDSVAATPTTVPPGTPTTVVVSAVITEPSLVTTSLSLLRTDATGKTLSTVGVMHDDGLNGDAVANDRTFSYAVSVSEAAAGTVYFRVSAAFRGVILRTLSPVVPIVVQASSSVAPSITLTVTPAPKANGWNNSPVTVQFVCTAGSAPIASCPADQVFSADGTGLTASGTVTDTAGRTASVTSAPFNIDRTAPTITASMTPPANANGWHAADVAVSFTCADAGSGVQTCTSPVTLSTEGSGVTTTGTVVDRAGNTATVNASANIDRTPPSIQGTTAPAAGGGITVTFVCSDVLSGVASCPPPQTVVSGTTSVHGEATDRAGNTASTDVEVSLDTTNPTIQITAAPQPNGTGWNNIPVELTFTCNDAQSGVASCPPPQTITTNGAGQVVSGTATDNAGNSASASVTLNIDQVAPALSVTSPLDGAVVSQVALRVSGTVGDPLSGLASLACNGTPATVTSGAFTCDLTLGAGTTGIAVIAIDRAGNTTTRTFSVTLGTNNAPTAAPGGPYQGTAGTAITFNGGASLDPDGDPLTYEWNFGDGSTGAGVQPSHTYATAGTFTVTLKVTDTHLGSATATTTAEIVLPNRQPTAAPGGPYSGDAGVALTFNAGGSSDPDGDTLTYSWIFSDGGSASGVNPRRTYTNAGTFQATLTVSDGRGGTATATVDVSIRPANRPPVAQAGGPYQGDTGAVIAFTAGGSQDPDGDPLVYSWSFGDGGVASGISPTHTYMAPGSYTAVVTVTDNRGGSATASALVTIVTANRIPTANGGGPYSARVGEPIQFDGSASIDPDDDALTFAWNLGDGRSRTGAKPTYAYDAKGTYTASLTVTDARGASHTASVQVIVTEATAGTNRPPVANAGGPYAGEAGLPISFSGALSSDPDGDALSYQWSFSDGGSATGKQVTHTFTTAQSFSATLTVTDVHMASSQAAVSVVVAPRADRGPPLITLSAPREILPGATVLISAAASDNVGVSKVVFEIAGFAPSEDTAAPYERTIQIPDVAAPGTTIAVTGSAFDAAGNKGVATLTLTIASAPDTTAPTLTLQHPTESAPGAEIRLGALAADSVGVENVTFFVNGQSIAVDSTAPYEAAYTVPDTLTAGAMLPVSAEARDFAGNKTRKDGTVVIIAAPDSTPPVLTFSAPEQARPGAVVTLTADVTDANGVAAVAFLSDGAPLGALSVGPYSITFTLPSDLPPGAQVQVQARATDFAGLEAQVTRSILIVSPDVASGLVVGEVFDDTTGLPIAGASVALFGALNATATQTDASGRFALAVDAGSTRIVITKDGWTSAFRQAEVTSGQVTELFDARLTPLGANPVSITPVLGGQVTAGGATLNVPAGAIAANRSLTLTPVGAHGLASLTPLGWAPVAAIDIAPRGTAFLQPASLDLPLPAGTAPGTTLTLARWDASIGGWRAVTTRQVAAGDQRLVAGVPSSDQYAWLRPDTVPAAPPVAQDGGVLEGVAPVALADAALATVTPQPKVLFYGPGARSDVSSVVTPGTPVPSGTLLQSRITENYQFAGGTTIQPASVLQDFAFFQSGDALVGRYPVTPSLTFEAATLEVGTIGVEVVTPGASSAAALLGASGAHVALGTGEALDVLPETSGGTRAVRIERLAAEALGVQLPQGLQFLGGVNFVLNGQPLSGPASLSIAKGSVPAGAQILLLQVAEVAGSTEFVLVGLGAVGGDRIAASFLLPTNQLPFRGIRDAGRYIFAQATVPVGFIAGRVLGTGDTAIPGARVSTDTFGVIALSDAAGFIAAAKVGPVALTALDIPRSDKGTVPATIGAAGAEVALDVRILPQPPQVTSTQPTEGAVNAPLVAPITLVFSKPIDPATATGANASRFALSSAAGPITGTVALSAANTVATFWPASPLESNTDYTFTIAPGITDMAGRPLGGALTLHFKTLNVQAPPVPPAGSITSTIPGSDGHTTVRGSAGTAGLHDIVSIENLTTGALTPVLLDPNGGFTVQVAAGLKDKLRLHIVSPANVETIYALPLFSQTNADGSVTSAVDAAGGRVEGPNGTFAEVKSGTFPDGALVTLRSIAEADFPVQLDTEQKKEFSFAGGVQVDFGGAVPTAYVNVGVPAAPGDTVTNQWIVAQSVIVGGMPALNAVDTAKLIEGKVRTSSPPCPGVTAAGVYGFYRAQHTVGLNYGVMYGSQYGGLRMTVDFPFATTTFAFPFMTLSYDVPVPVCLPVLNGRVTVVPNTQNIRLKQGVLAPADREVVVKNALAGLETHFPRDLMEMKFTVDGAKTDNLVVLLQDAAGVRTPATGVTVTEGAAGKLVIAIDADSITSAISRVVVQNVTRSTETQFGAEAMAIALPVAGGADDFFIVSALDAAGASRQLASGDFEVLSPNGVENLAAKASPGSIDPTLSEILLYNAEHPENPLPTSRARTKVELINETPARAFTVEIPGDSIVNGGFSFPFEGIADDTYAIRVSYAGAPEEYQRITQFRIVVSNPTTGQVVKTIVGQAPPRDEPLNLGLITDDGQPPMLTGSPSRLDSFDPAGSLTFNFSEAMSPASIKAAAIVERVKTVGGVTTRERVAGEWRVYNNGRTATFIPTHALGIGEEYSVTFAGNDALNPNGPGGATVTDAAGNSLSTTRLSIKTFTPRLLTTISQGRDGRLIEPMRHVTFERKVVNNKLRTFLFATSESRTSYKLLTFDVTDAENPEEKFSSFGGQGKKRITLVPDVGKNGNVAITYKKPIVTPPGSDPVCGAGTQFVGDMAITTSVVNEYSYLSFFDVTDPERPCVVGNKLLNATPDFLNSYTSPGTIHAMGFAEGVTYIRHTAGVAAYAAVREVGVMAADIGKNLEEPVPAERVKEAIFPGDYWDVVAVNDRLFAVEKTQRKLDILDPNLAPIASVNLPDEPRRVVFAKSYGTDDNDDGVITPAEQRDLAFIAGGQSIVVVDVTQVTAPSVLQSIKMNGPVRDLDFDASKNRLFAGGSWSRTGGGDGFFIIDISKPLNTVGDNDNDGWDDRVIYKRQYAQTITGFRVDTERGIAYIPTYPDGSAIANAGPGRLDILALYDNCCDLGIDFRTRHNEQRVRGDRAALLAQEKEALQKGIAQGLLTAATTCTLPSGITMIEQGSGACLWRGDCGSNYQPGLSDHDFEVFVPQATYTTAGACAVKALNEVFIDPLTSEPKPITVSSGAKIYFEDITFFPVVKELFETAKFDVNPPASGGSDAVGDMGLGRRSLLLKWLLEGAYVSGVPGYSLEGRSLDAILEDLKKVTGLPFVEGFEWASLQEYNLAKSKALVRVVGASSPDSSFNSLFVKQMHDAGKAGIRAAMARMAANPAANKIVLEVTRQSYNSNACIAVVATMFNPANWKEKPCTSFEEYVASAAARVLRSGSALFTRAEVVDEITRFYKVKADLERIVSDAQADTFVSVTAQFIERAKAETLPIFNQYIGNDPDRVQRNTNVAQSQNKTAAALSSAKLTLSPRVFNRGFRSGNNVRIAMYKSDAAGTGTLEKEIREDVPGGDDRTITWARQGDGSLVLSGGQAVPNFKLEVNQTQGFGVPHGVSFLIDIPDKSVNEANRQNNLGGFFYYVTDPAHPTPVSTPPSPYLPLPGNDLLDPDAACSAGPSLTMTQTLTINGQPLLGEANVGFGETIQITLTAQNLSSEPMQDVVVCSNVTNQCYSLGMIGAGSSKTHTVTFTAPTKGVIVDGTATVYSPSTGVVEGSSTRVVIGCEAYSVVPLPYNPEKSEVQMGGSAYRYYRVVNKRTGAPITGAIVEVEVAGTFTGGVTRKNFQFTTGPQGEIKTGGETGLKLTPDDTWLTLVTGFEYDVTVSAVNGVAATCTTPEKFTIVVKPREYTLSYSRGTEIKGTIGAIYSAEIGAEVGTEIEKEVNSTSGPTALSISQTYQTSGKFGMEFSLFKFKGSIGVGTVDVGVKAGTTGRSFNGGGLKTTFTYPLDAEESCVIANITLTSMFSVNPLITKLVELARSQPCADPTKYVVSTSREFGRDSKDKVSLKANFGRPAPGFGDADKVIGVDFGVNGSNGFGITSKYSLGYKANPQGALDVITTTEGYSLKGGIDFSAGLSLMPQDPPEEGGEKDEAGEPEADAFKKALDVTATYGGETAFGVSFKTDLTKLRPDLKPNEISISYNGPKRWGWKRDFAGNEQNLGDGFTGSYSYTLDTEELVDKAVANLASLEAIHKASARIEAASQVVPLEPTILNQELGKFSTLFYDSPISYSVSKEKGSGFTVPFGLEGAALGLKLGAEVEFKSESKVGWTKAKGVRYRGRDIPLESYGDTQPAPNDFGIWETIQDTWKALLTSFAPQFSDVGRRFDNAVHEILTIQSLFTATLSVDTSTLPEPVDARLLSWRFTPTTVPTSGYRYMPADSSGRGDAPHYGIGGFHQFSPEGFNLGGQRTLVIDYKDEDVVGLDESSFRIYAWNTETHDWDYVGGTPDPAANTVTTTVDRFRLYTLAPTMPARAIGMTVAGGEVTGSGDSAKRKFTVTASGLVTNAGQQVPNGTMYTVRSAPETGSALIDYGTILTPDADPDTEGLQVFATNGAFSFEVEFQTPNGAYVPARAVVYSSLGTAFGEVPLTAPATGGQQ